MLPGGEKAEIIEEIIWPPEAEFGFWGWIIPDEVSFCHNEADYPSQLVAGFDPIPECVQNWAEYSELPQQRFLHDHHFDVGMGSLFILWHV